MAILGTSGDDILHDTPDAEDIRGGAGNDIIVSYAGPDRQYGEAGNDRMEASGPGRWLLDGGEGDDSLAFSGSNRGAGASADLIGGDGDDLIRAQVADQLWISGGSGDDTVELFGCGPMAISLGDGRDILTIGGYGASTAGLATVKDFSAGETGDVLTLDLLVSSLNPTWDQQSNPFGLGLVRLRADAGDVLVEVRDGSIFKLTVRLEDVALSELTATNFDGWRLDGSGRDSTLIVGGTGNDYLQGDQRPDVIEGRGGDDTLFGGAGDDRLFGADGADDIRGWDGDDLAEGGLGDDRIDGGAGDDRVDGGEGDDTLIDSGGSGVIRGGDGADVIEFGGGGDGTWIDGGEGADLIELSLGAHDVLLRAFGGAGDDVVKMEGVSNTRIDLGSGDDRISLTTFAGRHVVTMGEGADLLTLAVPEFTATPRDNFELFVKDFAPDKGDALDLRGWLKEAVPTWDGETHPFALELLTLKQVGRDTVLFVDRGAGFETLITFQGVAVEDFDSLSGFALGEIFDPIFYRGGADIDDFAGGFGDDDIVGNAGDDLLGGGFGDDLIRGGEGDDTLTGEFGRDVVHGDGGDDRLQGGAGDDQVFGGAGDDEILALVGVAKGWTELLDGGAGADVLSLAFSEDAKFVKPEGSAVILGRSGNDRIVVGRFDGAVVDAGDGDDIVVIDMQRDDFWETVTAKSSVILGAGEDVIDLSFDQGRSQTVKPPVFQDFQTGVGGDIFRAGGLDLAAAWIDKRIEIQSSSNGAVVRCRFDYFGNEVWVSLGFLSGVDGNLLTGFNFGVPMGSVIQGTSSDDDQVGSRTDDVFRPTRGADRMSGGLGNDAYGVNDVGDIVVELAAGGHDRVEASLSYTLTDHVEDLLLTGEADLTATGNQGNNRLVGNAGDNLIDGRGGYDLMQGLRGDDTYIVSELTDRVFEAAGCGDDHVISWQDFNILGESIERVTLMGQAVAVYGGRGDETLTGNDRDNRLEGLAGADTLIGGLGADTLIGGAGDDTYGVDNRSDRVIELKNQGDDHVLASVNYNLSGQYIERLTLTGSVKYGTGNSLENTLTGNAANNVLDGGSAADVLVGGAGHDRYYVDNAADRVVELNREGDDRVVASVSYDLGGTYVERLDLAGSGHIHATGNSLANILTGNSGNNRLEGGGGADTLIGGDGTDRYVYLNAADSTVTASDRIVGLNRGDRLDLSAIDADGLAANGDSAFALVDAFDGEGGQAVLDYDAARQESVLRLDIDGDGMADMRILIDGEVNAARIIW